MSPLRQKLELSVVIPVYRELETLSLLCEQFRAVVPANISYEIIFVNDGNRGNEVFAALEQLKKVPQNKSHVKVIHLSRNFGQHIAIAAGLKNSSGRFIIVMDADLQHRPADCFKFYQVAIEKNAEVVLSILPSKSHGFFKKLTARFFYKLMTLLGTPLTRNDLGSAYLISSHVAAGLEHMLDRYRTTITMVLWLTMEVEYCTIPHYPREHGKSGYTPLKLIRHGIEAVTAFSSKPLYIALAFSGLFILAASFEVIYLLVQRWVFHQTFETGWTSLFLLILIASSVILGCLGIMGLYLGRVFEAAKARPLYFTQQTDPSERIYLFEDSDSSPDM